MPENKPKFGPEQYPAGATIIQQGGEPDKFYIITRGYVQVLYQPPDGLDTIIDRMGPGDYFGEVGLMRRSRRMASVRAQTAVELMVMDYHTFMNWMRSTPEAAAEMDALVEERLLHASEQPELLAQDEALTAASLATETMHPEADNLADAPAPALNSDAEPIAQFQTGDIIIHQGDVADKFYVIIEGFVTVSHTLPNGAQQTIDHLTSGDYFGEIGLLDGSPRIATVTALTEVKLLSFDRDTFKNWMRKSPGSREELRREASRRRRDTGALRLPGNSAQASGRGDGRIER